MNNIYYRPYLEQGKTTYFPYTREKLMERPIFPTFNFDGGAFFFANDYFKTTDGDKLLDMIMDGTLFDYWTRDGVHPSTEGHGLIANELVKAVL